MSWLFLKGSARVQAVVFVELTVRNSRSSAVEGVWLRVNNETREFGSDHRFALCAAIAELRAEARTGFTRLRSAS